MGPLLFRKKNGFTYIEILVSILIFMFAALSLSVALFGFVSLNKQRNEIAIAEQLVYLKTEEYRSEKIPSVSSQLGYIEYSAKEIINTNTDDPSVNKIYESIKVRVYISTFNQLNDVMWKVSIVAYKFNPQKNKYTTLAQNTLLVGN